MNDESLKKLNEAIEEQKIQKAEFEVSKQLFLNNLKFQILTPNYMNKTQQQFVNNNQLHPGVLNYYDNKKPLSKQLDVLKIANNIEMNFYQQLYDYVSNEIGDKNGYKEVYNLQLLNTIKFIQNNEVDLSELKRQNKDIDIKYQIREIFKLDPNNLNDPLSFNAESLYYYNMAFNQYLYSLNEEEFSKLLKKKNYDEIEYQNTYKKQPPKYTPKQISEYYKMVENNVKKDLEVWNKFKESDKQDLLKAVKFMLNQEENNFEKHGAFLIDGYNDDIREFLNDANNEKYLLKNKSRLKKTYETYFNTLDNIINYSRINKSFNDSVSKLKGDALEKLIKRPINEKTTYEINNIADNFLNNPQEIDANIFKQSVLKDIPDYQLLSFIKAHYEIEDNKIIDSEILTPAGAFKETFNFNGKLYGDKEFREEIKNLMVNYFILDDDKDGENNIKELYKNRYNNVNGEWIFDNKLTLSQNGKTFNFTLLKTNSNVLDYKQNLAKQRDEAITFFDGLLTEHINHKKQKEANINQIREKNQKALNKLKQDGILIKTLGLFRKRSVLLGLMLLNAPLAFGMLGLSFLAHRVALWIKKGKNKYYNDKYQKEIENQLSIKDILDQNKLKTFNELKDMNKINLPSYELNKEKTELFINQLQKGIIPFPSGKVQNADKKNRKILKDINNDYVNNLENLINNKNKTLEISLQNFKGENNFEKYDNFNKTVNLLLDENINDKLSKEQINSQINKYITNDYQKKYDYLSVEEFRLLMLDTIIYNNAVNKKDTSMLVEKPEYSESIEENKNVKQKSKGRTM